MSYFVFVVLFCDMLGAGLVFCWFLVCLFCLVCFVCLFCLFVCVGGRFLCTDSSHLNVAQRGGSASEGRKLRRSPLGKSREPHPAKAPRVPFGRCPIYCEETGLLCSRNTQILKSTLLLGLIHFDDCDSL